MAFALDALSKIVSNPSFKRISRSLDTRKVLLQHINNLANKALISPISTDEFRGRKYPTDFMGNAPSFNTLDVTRQFKR
jgi:hypothetical protein